MEPENNTDAQAAPAALAEVPPLALAVGESVTLAASQAGDVIDAEREVQRMHLNIGAHREQFLVEEARMMTALGAARRAFESKVKAAGESLGIVFEGDALFSYDSAKRTFTRTK